MPKIIAVLQARMGSTRFPGKVMQPIIGVPLIELMLRRLARSEQLDNIVLATSVDPRNEPLARYVESLGYPVYRGNENDVLDRYYQAARQFKPDYVVRVTGDCPLIDPQLVDLVIDRVLTAKADYATNATPPTYPNGLDAEICTFSALERAWTESTKQFDREHVTPYLRDSGKFNWVSVTNKEDWSSERWTIDEPEDYEVINAIFQHFSPRVDFSWIEVLELLAATPALFEANRHLVRDEGGYLSTGAKLWKRARRVIPGGSMLLSKKAEMFLPDRWPAYFDKAKGCRIWDLEGRELIDTSFMGIGTNTLGYGHPEVDAVVHGVVDRGNLSTLNCPEEVALAEKLIELHPWAEMVRFARSGGEANAIAIRIARAAAGKTGVAFCGYHGWHDWYLAANLAEGDRLQGHLLPGLDPLGVPAELRGTVFPFSFNRLDELTAILDHHEVGVICMEVMRNVEPTPGFLEAVRALATEKNIVLIFDECTSGFRQTFGGIHLQFGVVPDVAVFGKALGNGYAITAVIGRRAVMESAQSTFISSTFWTERIGPAAAVKTLEVMQRERSWEVITQIGKDVSSRWVQLARGHSVPIKVTGLPALTGFTFGNAQPLHYKTYLTQAMLDNGFLASTSFYTSISHTRDVIDRYFDALDGVFTTLAECERGRPIDSLLKGPVCQSGFRRLN